MTRPRPTSVLVASTALLALAPTAASAATWRHTDAAGDVLVSAYDVDSEPLGSGVDPSVRDGDVVTSSLRHGPYRVVSTVHLRRLGTAVPTTFTAGYRASSGVRRWVSLTVDATRPRGQVMMATPAGDPVRCRGLERRVDLRRATLVISVPRACLGRPRWVSGTAMVARSDHDPDFTRIRTYVDDGLLVGTTRSPGWSPRVRRG